MRVTILGSGGSGGVPFADGTPGGNWGVCDPENPRNRRTRVSVLVESNGTILLIDASPDLRQQILVNGIEKIDALLFTHAHADHCHGLDDLRALVYRQRAPIPAYMSAATRRGLIAKFGYAFTSGRQDDSLYRALLDDREISGSTEIGGVTVKPFEQQHGPETSTGFRIGGFAYSTDVSALDEAAFASLEELDLWVLDGLRDRPHPTHSHIAQSLDWIARAKPAHAVLTHLNHEVDYAELAGRCPDGVEPAYDGLTFVLPD